MSVLSDILNPAFSVDDAVRVILQSFKHGTIGKVFCGYLNLLEQIFGAGVDEE